MAAKMATMIGDVTAHLPNHMYFETDFKVFKKYFEYLNTIFLYFNPIWQNNLNLFSAFEN